MLENRRLINAGWGRVGTKRPDRLPKIRLLHLYFLASEKESPGAARWRLAAAAAAAITARTSVGGVRAREWGPAMGLWLLWALLRLPEDGGCPSLIATSSGTVWDRRVGELGDIRPPGGESGEFAGTSWAPGPGSTPAGLPGGLAGVTLTS